jgi:hypothetical protein
MKPRSLHWLRERINIRAVHKVIVVSEIAAFLIHLNRADLLLQAGAISGDAWRQTRITSALQPSVFRKTPFTR